MFKKRINRSKKFLTSIAISTCLLPLTAAAQIVIQKPNKLSNSAEAGRVVAQHESFTVAGAMQDALLKTGESPIHGNPIGAQGAAYVFENGNPTPKAVYQFPGNANYFMQFGARVAVSGKWLAFTATNAGDANAPAKVFIVGKNSSNEWRTCPTGSSGVDCAGSYGSNDLNSEDKVLKTIEFDVGENIPSAKNWLYHNIAISDNYLVTANINASLIDVYRYEQSQNKWIKEWTHDDVDSDKLGTAIAIEGDRIIFSAPGFNSNVGRFYAIQRTTGSQPWQWADAKDGPGKGGNFGKTLDLHNGRIIAGGGNTLSFYNYDTYGIFAVNTITTPDEPIAVSVFGDTAVAAFGSSLAAARTYKLNSAQTTWQLFETIQSSIVPLDASGLAFSASDIDLHNNNIVFGWRGRTATDANGNNVNNVGAVVLKDFTNTNCKSVINFVPNCTFDIPTATNWSLLKHNGANASVSYNNTEMRTTIFDDGYDFWHVQARTPVNLHTAGTYTLRFKARADAARSIVVNLGHNGNSDNNWQSYAQKIVNLTTSMQTFTYTLSGIPKDINAFLDFNLGNAGNAAVTIDEVYLSRNP